MEIIGTIREIFDEVEVQSKVLSDAKSSSNFKIRRFGLTCVGNPAFQPDEIEFETTGLRCELLDRFKVGDKVKLFFNIKGRRHVFDGDVIKYFNKLQVWKIEKVDDYNTNDVNENAYNDMNTGFDNNVDTAENVDTDFDENVNKTDDVVNDDDLVFKI